MKKIPKLFGFVLVTVGLLSACAPDAPAPTLEVSPNSMTVVAGGQPMPFTATLTNSDATITWELTGQGTMVASKTSVGVSGQKSQSTLYTPPSEVAASTTVVLTARAAGLSSSANIVVNPAPQNGAKGTLVLNLNPPDGVSDFAGEILVSSAAGFSQTVAGTQSLDLTPGTYTVLARDVRKSGAVVDTVFRGYVYGAGGGTNPRTVAIIAGKTDTLEVYYDALTSSGRAWVVDWDSSVGKSYADDVLKNASGNPGFSSSITNSGLFNSAALDKKLNLWVSNSDNQIVQYSALSMSVIQTINTPAGDDGPYGLAFDKQGTLWAVDSINDRILGYPKAILDLGVGGSPTPTVIDLPGAGRLFGIAFDSGGNMWVSDYTLNKIYKFDSATLASNPAPSVTISAKANPFPGTGVTTTLAGPRGLSFDKDSKLWVSNLGNATVARFDPPAVNSQPTPTLMLTGLTAPWSVAFDKSGDLWVGGGGSLKRFTSAQIGSNSGAAALTPASSLGIGVNAVGLVFAPVSSNLPLYQRKK